MSGENEIEIRRMLQQFGHQISEMNSTCITDIAGDIKKSDFLDLARSISVLRARYLREVLHIAHAHDEQLDSKLFHAVKEAREAYEEALKSFEQLKHALQRGYFNLLGDE